MNNKTDFSNGKLLPLILRFSIPAAASLLITAIYNIVDRIFVGNFVGNTALAALSICFPISFIIISLGLMCSAGGATLFSLFRGKEDDFKAQRAFSNAFILTIIFELLLTVVLLLFPDFFLSIFGVTETTYDLALAYYNIVVLGCLFQGLTFVFCDFVRVSGKPVLGMMVTGVGAITNIILDAVFIISFGWGVEGAAYATVIGQILSAAFGAFLIFRGKTLVRVSRKSFRLDFPTSRRLLNCGLAFFISQMAMGFITLVYNGRLGTYGGDDAISVYAVIASIMTFVVMPANGISQGIQPLIGYNYGSGNGERVKSIMKLSTSLSVGLTSVIWLFVELFPDAIMSIFGASGEVLALGVPALRINFIITPVVGFVALAITFFQSIEKPIASSVITIVRQIVALVPLLYILPIFFGINGIFFAQPICDLVSFVIAAVLIRKEFQTLTATEQQIPDIKPEAILLNQD